MRILVIEDEHRVGQSIKKGLEQERFAVDLVYDGTDGFDLACSEPYDCILLDLMLPGLDGFSLCENLRKKNIHTPILMLTAKGQIKDKVSGLSAGADDYLTKPFSFEELIQRVRALLRRPHEISHERIRVRDLSVDTQTFSVTRGHDPIHLSSTEYSLLVFLMRHAARIVTKEQMISHVWNYDADILPNTVEVYVKNLRKKIDQPYPEEKPLIETVRGFGYILGKN